MLERSIAFGHRGAANTMAHDVHAQPAASDNVLLESCFIVGSTTDAGMFDNFYSFPSGVDVLAPPPTPNGAPHGGGVDGFVFSIGESATSHLLFVPWYTFRGGPDDEGLNGVAAWNEFRGQVAVVGWKHVDEDDYDIDVGSYYTSESYGGTQTWAMRPLTGAQVGGEKWEAPAVNGQSEVTRGGDASTPFWDFGLGGPSSYPLGNPASPRGGGISQDQTGRVHIVGATRSPGSYPVVGGLGKQADLQDAVKTALDLLPATMARKVRLLPCVAFKASPMPKSLRSSATAGSTNIMRSM